MTDSINININVSFPDLNDEKLELTDWVELVKCVKKILRDENNGVNPFSETNKSLAKKEEEAQALEWAEKVLSGEESQRSAEMKSGISRFKIAKAMNKIIVANGGENPFKQHED